MTIYGSVIVLFAIVCTTLVLFSKLNLGLLGNVVLPLFDCPIPGGGKTMDKQTAFMKPSTLVPRCPVSVSIDAGNPSAEALSCGCDR